ncbi:hypothetical protein HY045_03440 [Candidatus Woesebacteria bacterium]|nr:hypothetical protein [Candidatus Woesebacteria bacterium]
MTLSSFKKQSKFSIFLFLLVIYGLGSYLLGKGSFKLPNLNISNNIKGVSTKNGIVTPVDSPVPFADTQTTTIVSSYVKQCSNTKYGFEVSYPKDWFTTYDNEDQKCLYYAPYSFTLPGSLDNFQTPIKLEIPSQDDWPGVVKFFENPNDFQNVISVKNIAINGDAVERIEAQSTGAGSTAKNMAKLTFLYPHSKLPVVLTYQQTDTKENVAANKKILEEMTTSLKRF